ncbi:MAG: glycosyltransferase, partial [Polyangiales bacterium]
MKLVVNISSIGPRSTGLGNYAVHCARAAALALDAEVVAAHGVDGFDNVVLRAPASHAIGASRTAALRRWVWGKVQQPFPGRVMYSPTHHVLQGADAQVLTVHDLISLRFSRQHPTQHLYFRHILPRELTRCRAVFTVSETTKLDIHEAYGFPLDRIWVVPNGVDRDVFRPAETPVEREPFLL